MPASLLIKFILTVSAWPFPGGPPPAPLDQISHERWLLSLGAPVSPYSDYIFKWNAGQAAAPQPHAAQPEPDTLHVDVSLPLAEAARIEGLGLAEEGTTYGAESYARIEAPVEIVLETILFRWGKPVGQPAGETFSFDPIYGFRHDRISPRWGGQSYLSHTVRRNGGIARDTNDLYSVIVRKEAESVYTILISFLGPESHLATPTATYLSLLRVRANGPGTTDYRAVAFLNGQKYSSFGLENGRRNFGFNGGRVKEGLRDFVRQVESLKTTGKIPEKRL